MANAEPKNVNLRLERFEYRAVFSKTGRAKYISHLDLMSLSASVQKGAPANMAHSGFQSSCVYNVPTCIAPWH